MTGWRITVTLMYNITGQQKTETDVFITFSVFKRWQIKGGLRQQGAFQKKQGKSTEIDVLVILCPLKNDNAVYQAMELCLQCNLS